MTPANEFTQPINPISGSYPTDWPGYFFLQPRTPEGLPNAKHIGVDYNGPGGGNLDMGQEVLAVANGVVEKVIVWNGKAGYGNHMFIKHELNATLQKKYGCAILYSHYAHLQMFKCHEGEIVNKGQVVAKLGNTGTKYAHVHVEIRKPTGRGYEDYPTYQSTDWLLKYYFDTYRFIQDNLKEQNYTETQTPQVSTVDETATIPPVDPPTVVLVPSEPPIDTTPAPVTTDPVDTNNSDTPSVNVPEASQETVETVPEPPSVQPLSLEPLKRLWRWLIALFK